MMPVFFDFIIFVCLHQPAFAFSRLLLRDPVISKMSLSGLMILLNREILVDFVRIDILNWNTNERERFHVSPDDIHV